MIGSIEMGRKSETLLGLETFGMGTTLADLKQNVKEPDSKQRFKIEHTAKDNEQAESFKIQEEMTSGPLPLL